MLAALVLAACGGSDSSASTSPSATSLQPDLAEVPSLTEVMASPPASTAAPLPIPTVEPGEKPPAFAELLKMFEYDENEPLEFTKEAAGVTTPAGNTGEWISFQGGGATATGFLVMPKGKGPFPVVVYAHGNGMGAENWLDEAAAMAKRGYAGLLVDEIGSSDLYLCSEDQQIAAWVRYVIQERRAFDLVATLPKLDASRIGFVGLSAGGSLGGLLVGVDDRVKACVLLGANGIEKQGVWDRQHKEKPYAVPIRAAAAFARWKAQVSVLDYATYVSHARGTRILFLAGKTDTLAVREGEDCLAAAPARTTLRIYDGDHYPIPPAVNAYWRAWMVRNL